MFESCCGLSVFCMSSVVQSLAAILAARAEVPHAGSGPMNGRALMEQHRCWVCGNILLRRVFGSEREVITES
jgi:hypothetical protein